MEVDLPDIMPNTFTHRPCIKDAFTSMLTTSEALIILKGRVFLCHSLVCFHWLTNSASNLISDCNLAWLHKIDFTTCTENKYLLMEFPRRALRKWCKSTYMDNFDEFHSRLWIWYELKPHNGDRAVWELSVAEWGWWSPSVTPVILSSISTKSRRA